MAACRQSSFFDYDGFVAKFAPKKTTDDCYTPENIYEAVRTWAVREYSLDGREIVRPFWPGRDYRDQKYPDGCVVIDNPPFSILGSIIECFNGMKVDYFLFSPYLTNFNYTKCNHVVAPVSVTYENGAQVDTSFVTNMGDWFIRTAPDLMDAIMVQEKINARKFRKASVKYEYPDAIITSAKVGYFCKHHVNYAVKRDDCAFVRKLDEQGGKTIFGGGYILSECAEYDKRAAEVAAHNNAVEERAMAELADAQSVRKWSLSGRERELQKYIGSKR